LLRPPPGRPDMVAVFSGGRDGEVRARVWEGEVEVEVEMIWIGLDWFVDLMRDLLVKL
jgi:hypothetical protein